MIFGGQLLFFKESIHLIYAMRIGIDARFLTHPQTGGFKTYTKNLVAALIKIDSDNEYTLYLDRIPDRQTWPLDSPNSVTRVVPGSTPLIGMPWREQMALTRRTALDRLDLLHSPCLTAPLRLACPSVVTIHDMLWYFPFKFSNNKSISGKRKVMAWYYRVVTEKAIRQAAAVITVSHAAKESIINHLRLPSESISVTYEAASPIYRLVRDHDKLEGIKQKYDLASNYVLAIGSADPRKNIELLVRAYASLPESLQQKYHLAVVWTHPLLAEAIIAQVASLDLRDRVHFLHRVCDEDLALLYNAASLFALPSRYEGFGLPLLEAMACGTPVVAAHNTSIPEIIGEAGILANPEDVVTMANSMAKVLSSENIQRDLIEKGLRRAAAFSWQKCAYETLEIYRRVIANDKMEV
jgi:glycosyltransferase involved in cell wall biosynthesis